jgi:hypothetical protein
VRLRRAARAHGRLAPIDLPSYAVRRPPRALDALIARCQDRPSGEASSVEVAERLSLPATSYFASHRTASHLAPRPRPEMRDLDASRHGRSSRPADVPSLARAFDDLGSHMRVASLARFACGEESVRDLLLRMMPRLERKRRGIVAQQSVGDVYNGQ